jgi:hypothetical protein
MDIGTTEIVLAGLGIVAAFAVTKLYPKLNMLSRNTLSDDEARAMVQQRLADSDVEVTAAMLVREALELRPDIEEARARVEPIWEERRQQMEAGKRRWKPGLLADDDLRALCVEFERESTAIFFDALGVNNGYMRDSFLASSGKRLARLSELRTLIEHRLEAGLSTAY